MEYFCRQEMVMLCMASSHEPMQMLRSTNLLNKRNYVVNWGWVDPTSLATEQMRPSVSKSST